MALYISNLVFVSSRVQLPPSTPIKTGDKITAFIALIGIVASIGLATFLHFYSNPVFQEWGVMTVILIPISTLVLLQVFRRILERAKETKIPEQAPFFIEINIGNRTLLAIAACVTCLCWMAMPILLFAPNPVLHPIAFLVLGGSAVPASIYLHAARHFQSKQELPSSIKEEVLKQSTWPPLPEVSENPQKVNEIKDDKKGDTSPGVGIIHSSLEEKSSPLSSQPEKAKKPAIYNRLPNRRERRFWWNFYKVHGSGYLEEAFVAHITTLSDPKAPLPERQKALLKLLPLFVRYIRSCVYHPLKAPEDLKKIIGFLQGDFESLCDIFQPLLNLLDSTEDTTRIFFQERISVLLFYGLTHIPLYEDTFAEQMHQAFVKLSPYCFAQELPDDLVTAYLEDVAGIRDPDDLPRFSIEALPQNFVYSPLLGEFVKAMPKVVKMLEALVLKDITSNKYSLSGSSQKHTTLIEMKKFFDTLRGLQAEFEKKIASFPNLSKNEESLPPLSEEVKARKEKQIAKAIQDLVFDPNTNKDFLQLGIDYFIFHLEKIVKEASNSDDLSTNGVKEWLEKQTNEFLAKINKMSPAERTLAAPFPIPLQELILFTDVLSSCIEQTTPKVIGFLQEHKLSVFLLPQLLLQGVPNELYARYITEEPLLLEEPEEKLSPEEKYKDFTKEFDSGILKKLSPVLGYSVLGKELGIKRQIRSQIEKKIKKLNEKINIHNKILQNHPEHQGKYKTMQPLKNTWNALIQFYLPNFPLTEEDLPEKSLQGIILGFLMGVIGRTDTKKRYCTFMKGLTDCYQALYQLDLDIDDQETLKGAVYDTFSEYLKINKK